ncbi:MAG: LysR family transcriptional regulator ArgP [Pseudomonadota bacterium]
MIDYPALAALTAVLRSGSFEAAADQLGLSQSAVSQRIKGLEDRMGTILIHRTRPATATETGRRLMQHAEEVALLERTLGQDLITLRPARTTPVRIAVTADSLASFLLPALAAIDGLLFDLVIDDQDFSAELLKTGEVAAAVTTAAAPVTGCDAIPLGALPYTAFASPTYVERWFPDGVTAEALSSAPALTFNRKDALQNRMAAKIAGHPVTLTTHYVGATQAITDAAIAGLGWAVNPTPLITPHFPTGALIDLAPGIQINTPLMWQIPRQNRAALQDLTTAIRDAAKRAMQS